MGNPADAVDPRLEFSAWLHRELTSAYAVETEAWATERVSRVMARLNAARPHRAPLEAEILWIPECTAFTAPGRYVYISRRLLERCPSDEAAAFVLAHDAAHHDCGHLDLFAGWAERVPRSVPGGVLAALLVRAQHVAYGPEREAEADLRAMELCAAAGYGGDRCAQALEILENYALDAGDYDGVFGPENLLDPTDPGQGSVGFRVQRWLWTRARGYLPLRERRDRVRAWLRAGGR